MQQNLWCPTRRLTEAVRVSSLAMLVSAMPAWAQDAADETEGAVVLDTLVLEGTKAGRDFTATTASVGVLDSATIEQQGITDLGDAFSQLGNVRNFGSGGGSADTGFVIRGLGATQGVSVATAGQYAPLTSVIVDGTPQSFNSIVRGSRGMWDVEQVEVFRGPQSTLQGRGTMAGAVIITSKDPTDYPEGKISLTAGADDRRDAAFMLSGPLIDGVLSARISGEYRSRDTGIDFTLPESRFFGEDRYRSLRAKFLLTPPDTPNLSFLLTISDTYDKPGLHVSTTTDDWFRRQYNALTYDEVREADNLNVSLEARYDLGNGNNLTSVTSFLKASTHARTLPSSPYSREMDWKDKNVTQDLRLTFGDPSGLSGVAGLFYGRFTQPRDEVMMNGTLIAQDITQDNKTTNVSAYADVNWRFAPSWSLIAGGRLLHEKVSSDWTYCGVTFSPPYPCFPGLDKKIAQSAISDTVFLPKLGLMHHFGDSHTLSATMQRGYRSGFVAVTEGDAAGPSQVKPEYLTSYELAWRLEDPDRFWRLGTTVFYSRYSDQQITAVRDEGGVPISRTRNVGKSEMYGAEVEGSYAFESGWTVHGSLGLLKTKFLEYSTLANGSQDYSGNEFPESPHVTASLGATYQHPSGFFGGVTASHTGSYYSYGSVENAPELKISGFTQVNARLGYQADHWEIVAYVDNLFDRDYVTGLSRPSGSTVASSAVVSDERSFGIELSAKF